MGVAVVLVGEHVEALGRVGAGGAQALVGRQVLVLHLCVCVCSETREMENAKRVCMCVT